jgi:hypothetical protein
MTHPHLARSLLAVTIGLLFAIAPVNAQPEDGPSLHRVSELTGPLSPALSP